MMLKFSILATGKVEFTYNQRAGERPMKKPMQAWVWGENQDFDFGCEAPIRPQTGGVRWAAGDGSGI